MLNALMGRAPGEQPAAQMPKQVAVKSEKYEAGSPGDDLGGCILENIAIKKIVAKICALLSI